MDQPFAMPPNSEVKAVKQTEPTPDKSIGTIDREEDEKASMKSGRSEISRAKGVEMKEVPQMNTPSQFHSQGRAKRPIILSSSDEDEPRTRNPKHTRIETDHDLGLALKEEVSDEEKREGEKGFDTDLMKTDLDAEVLEPGGEDNSAGEKDLDKDLVKTDLDAEIPETKVSNASDYTTSKERLVADSTKLRKRILLTLPSLAALANSRACEQLTDVMWERAARFAKIDPNITSNDSRVKMGCFARTLLQFQWYEVFWFHLMVRNDDIEGGFLADDMGTGKVSNICRPWYLETVANLADNLDDASSRNHCT